MHAMLPTSVAERAVLLLQLLLLLFPSCCVTHFNPPSILLVRTACLYALPLQLVELMKTGKLKVTIDQVLPLAEAAKAHEVSEAGHVRGKLVLQVAKE
jgi:hypothetical protein